VCPPSLVSPIRQPVGQTCLASSDRTLDSSNEVIPFGAAERRLVEPDFAADRAGNGNVTIASAVGCLVHDDTITAGTVAKQGMCFDYFGGTQSVTAGTFTIVWDATGVFKFTN
jgi:hypothetical protein